jgi:hypothetical protein
MEFDSSKKRFEAIADQKEELITDLRVQLERKTQEVKDIRHLLDSKNTDIKARDKQISQLEKTLDESKKKHQKEVERLELDKSGIENHYLSELR